MACLSRCSLMALLVTSLAAVPATLCGADRPPLGVADTMEKVFAEAPWNRPAPTEACIEAARNEVEGVQVIVPAGATSDLRGATVQTGELTGPGGAAIPASCVTWNVVGYVQTEKPNVCAWPDPLLPDRTFDVGAGRVQPVWVNVRVPETTPPGVYRGTLRVVAPSEPPRSSCRATSRSMSAAKSGQSLRLTLTRWSRQRSIHRSYHSIDSFGLR
jgi:hypothetical protein